MSSKYAKALKKKKKFTVNSCKLWTKTLKIDFWYLWATRNIISQLHFIKTPSTGLRNYFLKIQFEIPGKKEFSQKSRSAESNM